MTLTVLGWAVLLLSVSVCSLLLIAGAGRLWGNRGRQNDAPIWRPVAAPHRGEPSGTCSAPGVLDVGAELQMALATVAPHAARQFVALEFATHPGLAVQADPGVLHDVVTSLLLNAIGHAPSGRVLLTAAQGKGGVRIAVTDDGVPPDRAMQAGALCAAERCAASQGANLDIDVRPGEGTTVSFDLPVLPPQ